MHSSIKDTQVIAVNSNFADHSHINSVRYEQLYAESIQQPESFWAKQAQQYLMWTKPFTQLFEGNFAEGHVAWFADGELNVSVNCIDRHLPDKAEQTAIIWQGDAKEIYHSKNPFVDQFVHGRATGPITDGKNG